MEKIVAKRGHGKTRYMIELSARTGSVIVCHDRDQCGNILRRAQEMNLVIPEPITVGDFSFFRVRAVNKTGFLIDNIELFMRQAFPGAPINAISMSDEDNVKHLLFKPRAIGFSEFPPEPNRGERS